MPNPRHPNPQGVAYPIKFIIKAGWMPVAYAKFITFHHRQHLDIYVCNCFSEFKNKKQTENSSALENYSYGKKICIKYSHNATSKSQELLSVANLSQLSVATLSKAN